MEKLFLLKPDFKDPKLDAEKKYFCPYCAIIEGLFVYYPHLRSQLEVNHVDFPRPRPAIVELIGEENQSCPVLIKEDGSFINETKEIIQYLTTHYHIGEKH